jgi:hypothetical protein
VHFGKGGSHWWLGGNRKLENKMLSSDHQGSENKRTVNPDGNLFGLKELSKAYLWV